MFKHFAANAMTLLIVGCVALVGVVLVGVQEYRAPGPHAEAKRVVLERGVSLKEASEALEAQGVIASSSVFRIAARYQGVASDVKFGEYEIPARATTGDVLEIVVSGRSLQYRVTIAEGLTSWEIVEALRANDLLDGAIDEVPAEGSLAPDTYFVARGSARSELIKRMQAAQARILQTAWEMREEDTPLRTPEEALVLASIVEKETGLAAERPLVGGVFINRLRRGMRLQSDPTIIYGITNGEGPLDRGLTRSDIAKATPYNTYVIDRLPPAPIANPGREAILAVVRPEATDAIYFVADGTGGHAFATTLREHNRNVAKWREIERSRQN